jgi:hypothetical protein
MQPGTPRYGRNRSGFPPPTIGTNVVMVSSAVQAPRLSHDATVARGEDAINGQRGPFSRDEPEADHVARVRARPVPTATRVGPGASCQGAVRSQDPSAVRLSVGV